MQVAEDYLEEDVMPELRNERAELLADLRGLREMWRLPEIDGVPVQPTPDEMPDALRWWASAGIVASTGTLKFGPLVALIDGHLFTRLEQIRERLLALDAEAEWSRSATQAGIRAFDVALARAVA